MLKSFTSDRLKILTVSTSLAGLFCMSLADLLPWGLFLIIAAIHVIIFLKYFDHEAIGQIPALMLIIAAFGIEAFRISYMGRSEVVYALRDLIIILSIARLVMKKTLREIYQIEGIAFAECLLSTIFTTSPLILAGLILMVFILPMTLFALDEKSFSLREPAHSDGITHWVEVSAGIILTACLLFYVLPRPASSIIQHGFTQRARVHFREDVDLKQSGSMGEDTIIVMRIIWAYGSAPAVFYLSGSRLEGINPDGFFNREFRGSTSFVANGYTDRITIYPASLDSVNVFFPFRMNKVSPRTYLRKGSNIYWGIEVPQVYDVWVNRLPGSGNPCSMELPRELKSVGELGVKIAGDGDIRTKAGRIASYLKKTHAYTLDEQRVPSGSSAIDWFVFSGKKGRCEHFASATAAMLRGCGIPARVVTGFLVTEYNKDGDYFIVRASDAHAWTEYWDGAWHIIDATPEKTIIPNGPFHLLDELRFKWYRWVIQFSLDDQIHFASQIIAPSPLVTRQVESLGSYALSLFVAGGAFFIFFLLFRNNFLTPYDKVCNALKRKKMTLPPNTSHQEHIKMVSAGLPELGPLFKEYVALYLAWRFGDKDVDIRHHTKEIIERIRQNRL